MLIDFHTHCFPDKLAERAVGKLAAVAKLTPEYNGTADGLIEKMDKCGVDASVVLNIATNPGQMQNVNSFADQLLKKYEGRLYPLGSVHPDAELDTVEAELDRIVGFGIRGVKLHPDYMGATFDDPRFKPILEMCRERGLFVMIHAGFDVISPDLIHASPEMIARVADENRGLKIIAAHFGGNMLWEKVEADLAGKDVYFDTSLAAVYGMDKNLAERIIGKHGSDKLLFGSDGPWGSPADSFKFIDSLSVSDRVKEKIYSENARCLLGID